MAHAKSKRVSSRQRHKVERKMRENKRDMRKAAKVMKKSGLKLRSKKSRETAKLALRVSNANPEKEKILRNLMAVREAAKKERAERRASGKSSKAAGIRGDGDEDDVAASDNGSAGSGSDQEDEGAEARFFKRTRAELTEADERLTSRQVQLREKQKRREEAARAATEKQRAAISQHLLIPPGEHVGNPQLQFGKVVDRLRQQVPVFLVVLDARCPVQSAPWEHIDAIVADAVAHREELQAAAPAPSPAKGRKSGRKSAAGNGAEAEAPAAAAGVDAVQRLIVFVLNKADLVPLDMLALGASHMAEVAHRRYSEALVPAAPAHLNMTAPVAFTCLPHSAVIELSAKTLLRTLRQFQSDVVNTRDKVLEETSNMKGKLGCCVIGLPGVGKTTVCRCVHECGTDSVVSTVPCRTVRTAQPKDSSAGEATKIIIPGAKQITLVTIADDEALKAAPIVAGDAAFHSISRIEKMKEPEGPALLLAEAFRDQPALCRALSLPIMPAAAPFLKAFGRCIIREKGFQPAGVFADVGGALSSSALSVSDAAGAAQYVAGLKRVRVRPRHDDKRNALRIGARTFLKEFHAGKHVVWAVRQRQEMDDAADVTEEQAAAMINLFVPLHTPKPVATALAGGDEAKLSAAVKDAPGAVLLMIIEYAMRDAVAMLPQKALDVDPRAVVPPALEDDDEDDEEDTDFEDEEEEEDLEEADEEEEGDE